jgi:IS5 family transposase
LIECGSLRRKAIEPIIGHLKNDGLLGRNYLKGELGDALHAILCGDCHNPQALGIFWSHVWQPLSRLWDLFSSEPFLSLA